MVAAEYSLGWCLREGRGGPRDRAAGFRWLLAAAHQRDPDAELDVGAALFNGEGVRRDRRGALRWYLRSSRHGENRWGAMGNIGLMYQHGHGVPQSWARAIHWYRRAAKAGSTAAAERLLRIYEGKVGRPPNARAAARWRRALSVRR